MKIKHCVSNELLNMRLIDIRCKHAMRTSDRACEVIQFSSIIGYDIAEWGACSNHVDIRYHADVIMKMEEDNYNHAERIVICNYDFYKKPCIWLDNIHSAVMYVRKYGLNVTLKDIPFYVIDISNNEPIISENEPGTLDMNMQHIEDAINCAYKRQERSNSKDLIDLNYLFGEFLTDNPVLLACTDYFGTDGALRGAKYTDVLRL